MPRKLAFSHVKRVDPTCGKGISRILARAFVSSLKANISPFRGSLPAKEVIRASVHRFQSRRSEDDGQMRSLLEEGLAFRLVKLN
jgi:hypothetical protein